MQVTKSLSELEKAIAEARKQCDEATAGECAAAWDTVEELSAAIAHKKAAVSTPLPCSPIPSLNNVAVSVDSARLMADCCHH